MLITGDKAITTKKKIKETTRKRRQPATITSKTFSTAFPPDSNIGRGANA